MSAFDELMKYPGNRVRNPKKRWCTVCSNDKRASAREGQTHNLTTYLRPQTWMSEPLDLSTDVVTVIVEALMGSSDDDRVRTIKTLALVNRLCASAVASTCEEVRGNLQKNAKALALARKDREWHTCKCRNSTHRVVSAHSREEVRRMHEAHDLYMQSVGIPNGRRIKLLLFADRTWFHDRLSLFGHLENGCELCGNPQGRLARMGCYVFRDGPVMLAACEKCKARSCVELMLEYAGDTSQMLRVEVDSSETEGNSYARALLSKQSAHRKRMCAKQTARLRPANLGKRVHTIGLTEELGMFYWNSSHSMRDEPWFIDLWHTLPKGLPQDLTFSALMGVRDSDAVRDEAQRYAKGLRAVRAQAAQKRSALAQLMRTHNEACQQVALVVRMGHFEGWVQAIDVCTTARAFDARWMFRRYEGSGALPNDWRAARYHLLEMDQDELAASVKRVAAVAQVLLKAFSRTDCPTKHYKHKTTERDVVLKLLRNFAPAFLEGPVERVDKLVEIVRRAPVVLTLRPTATGQLSMVATYTLGGMFKGRLLEINVYITSYTILRICKAIACCPPRQKLEQSMLDELQNSANLTGDHVDNRAIRNQTRSAIFDLPAAWPAWLTAA